MAVSNSFVTTTVNGNTVATVTFQSSLRNSAGHLDDGNYQLTVDAAKVTRAGSTVGLAQDFVFGDVASDNFYSYFGDISGSRTPVLSSDLVQFRSTFRRSAGGVGYDPRMDFDADGLVGSLDLLRFRQRFRRTISFG